MLKDSANDDIVVVNGKNLTVKIAAVSDNLLYLYDSSAPDSSPLVLISETKDKISSVLQLDINFASLPKNILYLWVSFPDKVDLICWVVDYFAAINNRFIGRTTLSFLHKNTGVLLKIQSLSSKLDWNGITLFYFQSKTQTGPIFTIIPLNTIMCLHFAEIHRKNSKLNISAVSNAIDLGSFDSVVLPASEKNNPNHSITVHTSDWTASNVAAQFESSGNRSWQLILAESILSFTVSYISNRERKLIKYESQSHRVLRALQNFGPNAFANSLTCSLDASSQLEINRICTDSSFSDQNSSSRTLWSNCIAFCWIPEVHLMRYHSQLRQQLADECLARAVLMDTAVATGEALALCQYIMAKTTELGRYVLEDVARVHQWAEDALTELETRVVDQISKYLQALAQRGNNDCCATVADQLSIERTRQSLLGLSKVLASLRHRKIESFSYTLYSDSDSDAQLLNDHNYAMEEHRSYIVGVSALIVQLNTLVDTLDCISVLLNCPEFSLSCLLPPSIRPPNTADLSAVLSDRAAKRRDAKYEFFTPDILLVMRTARDCMLTRLGQIAPTKQDFKSVYDSLYNCMSIPALVRSLTEIFITPSRLATHLGVLLEPSELLLLSKSKEITPITYEPNDSNSKFLDCSAVTLSSQLTLWLCLDAYLVSLCTLNIEPEELIPMLNKLSVTLSRSLNLPVTASAFTLACWKVESSIDLENATVEICRPVHTVDGRALAIYPAIGATLLADQTAAGNRSAQHLASQLHICDPNIVPVFAPLLMAASYLHNSKTDDFVLGWSISRRFASSCGISGTDALTLSRVATDMYVRWSALYGCIDKFLACPMDVQEIAVVTHFVAELAEKDIALRDPNGWGVQLAFVWLLRQALPDNAQKLHDRHRAAVQTLTGRSAGAHVGAERQRLVNAYRSTPSVPFQYFREVRNNQTLPAVSILDTGYDLTAYLPLRESRPSFGDVPIPPPWFARHFVSPALVSNSKASKIQRSETFDYV